MLDRHFSFLFYHSLASFIIFILIYSLDIVPYSLVR